MRRSITSGATCTCKSYPPLSASPAASDMGMADALAPLPAAADDVELMFLIPLCQAVSRCFVRIWNSIRKSVQYAKRQKYITACTHVAQTSACEHLTFDCLCRHRQKPVPPHVRDWIIPPSTCSVAPVMYDAASESKNATARPNSLGSP